MKIVLGVLNKGKGKVFFRGNTLDLLTMSAIVVMFTAEKVGGEKALALAEAIDFVCDSIKEASKMLK